MQTLNKKSGLLLLLCLGSFLWMHAQPKLVTAVDKKNILIGEQFILKVNASIPPEDYFIKWMALPDTLQHFEIIKKSKIDSVFTNQKLTSISQEFTFTSFDSGTWVLPSFYVFLNPLKDDTSFNMFTDSVTINVSYQTDSSTALRPIKPIIAVKIPFPIWYWIFGGLIFIGVIAVVYWWFFHNKNKHAGSSNNNSKTALEEAMAALEKLRQQDVSTAISVKHFYSKLPEILKKYVSVTSSKDCFSKTSSDLLITINEIGIEREDLSKLAAVLRYSDAVKFAKYIPDLSENENCILGMQQTISKIETIITNKSAQS